MTNFSSPLRVALPVALAMAACSSDGGRPENATTSSEGLTAVAAYDAALRVPSCSASASGCDSGSLLVGRATLGPEANAPNTLAATCADGGSGTFHADESLDRLVVHTTDGSAFAPGGLVTIDATVWAYAAAASDHLDLYYAADATNPTWILLTTLTPPAAGAQMLTASYTLPAGGATQAVRGVFRYSGSPGACAAGPYNDHDDLAFAVTGGAPPPPPPPSGPIAAYDSALQAPKCAAVGPSCDTGTLVNGRALLGPEPHASNTLLGACADGASGAYHSDESLDRLKVYSADGTNLAPGKTATIEATVWAYSAYTYDQLDLYYAATAASPTWTFLATLTPRGPGAHTLTASYTVPAGAAVQAVRGAFRYSGTAGPCVAGAFNDRDDLAFAVAALPADTTPPTISLASPAAGPVSGVVPLAANASDDVGVTKVEYVVDDAVAATAIAAPFDATWDTAWVAAGAHTIVGRAYDAAGNVGTSAPVSVTTPAPIVVNGGFEAGFDPWIAPNGTVQTGPLAYQGLGYAALYLTSAALFQEIRQAVVLPAMATTLEARISSLWPNDLKQSASLGVELVNHTEADGGLVATGTSTNTPTATTAHSPSTYQLLSINVSQFAGKQVYVKVSASTQISATTSPFPSMSMLVDNVRVY